MPARLDHVVISVPDLASAIERWSEAGLPAVPGGRHPVGTENALVRGPQAAYVELISSASDAAHPVLDRVRRHPGPLSWAIAVDDVDAARTAVAAAGFSPGEVRDGSRTTPDGVIVAWRMCDVADRPYDAVLPFLIQWTTPMPPSPADGPVLDSVSLGLDGREDVARLLRALDLPEHDRRAGHGLAFDDGEVVVRLPPTPEEVDEWRSRATGDVVFTSVGSGPDVPGRGVTGIDLDLAVGAPAPWVELDGIHVSARPGVRSHPGHALLPDVEARFVGRDPALVEWPDPHPDREVTDEEYSRCLDPAKYLIIGARVRAWADALAHAGLAEVSETGPVLRVAPTTEGALAIEMHARGFDGVEGNVVDLEAAGVKLATLPDCGCDACDSGSADLLRQVDETFLHVLDGGLLHLADGRGNDLTTTYDGWAGSGSVDHESWLDDARRGELAGTVVTGEPWL